MSEKLKFLRKPSKISRIDLSYPADLEGALPITSVSSCIILCFSLLPLGHNTMIVVKPFRLNAPVPQDNNNC